MCANQHTGVIEMVDVLSPCSKTNKLIFTWEGHGLFPADCNRFSCPNDICIKGMTKMVQYRSMVTVLIIIEVRVLSLNWIQLTRFQDFQFVKTLCLIMCFPWSFEVMMVNSNFPSNLMGLPIGIDFYSGSISTHGMLKLMKS